MYQLKINKKSKIFEIFLKLRDQCYPPQKLPNKLETISKGKTEKSSIMPVNMLGNISPRFREKLVLPLGSNLMKFTYGINNTQFFSRKKFLNKQK